MGTSTSRSMVDSDSISPSGSEEDSEQDYAADYAAILQNILGRYAEAFRSGQVHILASNIEDEYNMGPPIPKIKDKPNTSVLARNDFSLLTKQKCGLGMVKRKHPTNVAAMLNNRETGIFTYNSFSNANKCKIGNRFLPNEMSILARYRLKAFCGTFSDDGQYFLSACEDRFIRVYSPEGGDYKIINQLRAREVGWSIIDVAFSPDNQHFVYSTWSSSVHMARTMADGHGQQEALCFSPTERRFCVFSVVYSADGTDILGGANDGYLYIYNWTTCKPSLKIFAHECDVNTVSFADKASQIIYSGGDDGLVKVWDRRTLSEENPKPVGILAGHMDGVTFIDTKGDGRYLISNSKDQSIKLWDVRVFSGSQAQKNTLRTVREQRWDYRWQDVPRKLYNPKTKLEGDTSVMTYKGHVVIKTLVRCRFSPAETTGQRYIYSGCGTGRVIIYDVLTGKIKRNLTGHNSCVRDVSWHPHRNEIISSGWDGVVGKWTYSGKESLESDEEEPDDSVFCGEERQPPKVLRRSRRIAQRRQREQQRINLQQT